MCLLPHTKSNHLSLSLSLTHTHTHNSTISHPHLFLGNNFPCLKHCCVSSVTNNSAYSIFLKELCHPHLSKRQKGKEKEKKEKKRRKREKRSRKKFQHQTLSILCDITVVNFRFQVSCAVTTFKVKWSTSQPITQIQMSFLLAKAIINRENQRSCTCWQIHLTVPKWQPNLRWTRV